jgi:threonine dehydratase
MTVAEGIGVAELGRLPRRIVDEYDIGLMTVSEAQIEHAMHYCLESLRTVVEGAGAAPIAALFADPNRFRGKRVGVVLSGGNIDTGLLTSVAAQARLLAGNVVRARIQINDVPGNLARVAAIIAEHKGNILEVTHQRVLRDLPAKCVALDITIDLRSPNLFDCMTDALRNADFPTAQLAMESVRA